MAEYDKKEGTKNMKPLVFYDRENDILAIHKECAHNEKFKGNIDTGQVVLDVSTNERIIGLEVMNASSFFEEFSLNEELLKNIEKVDFTAKQSPNGIVIGLLFQVKNKIERIPAKIAVPTNTV